MAHEVRKQSFSLDTSKRHPLVDRLREAGFEIEVLLNDGHRERIRCRRGGQETVLALGPGYNDLPNGFVVDVTPDYRLFDWKRRAFFARIKATLLACGGLPYDWSITLD